MVRCYKIYYTVVFMLLGIVIFPFLADAQGGAALFLNPGTGSFLVGSTFNLSVILDTKNVAANVVEAELLFPSGKVQLVNPSVGQSIIQVWPAPPKFSNSDGKIYFIGGIPSPGIVTSQGVVLTLTFRVISPGEGAISFGGRTSVLANDGNGTNFLEQKRPAFFKFLMPPPQGPEITSPSHPDQEKWYRDNNPIFIWAKNELSTGFSYNLDHDPASTPDANVDGSATMASFQNLDSGLWYFHLRARAQDIWGGVSTYPVKIDNQPPADFEIQVSPANTTINKNPIFRFFTTDSFSGFDHFEMKMVPLSKQDRNEFFFFEATSPYQALDLDVGRYEVIVRAIDKAGNSHDKSVTLNIRNSYMPFLTSEGIDATWFFIPWADMISALTVLLFLCAVFMFVLWRRHKHHLRHAFKEDINNALSHITGRKPK